MSTVRLARDGAVVRVTIDRPAQLNAISPELLEDLDAACAAVEADGDVRAVADLRVVEELAPDPERWAAFMDRWHEVFDRSQRLPRLVGARRAKELMLLGGCIGARQALERGLVNRVVAAGTVEAATLELARALAGKSGAASRTVKVLVDRGLDLDLPAGLALERTMVAEHMRTDDAAAGLRAFRERARRKESS